MKKQFLTLLILILLFTSNALLAQRKSIDERLQHLTKELNLSEEQQASIKTIMEDAKNKMDFLRENNTGDRKAIRDEIRKIMDGTNEKIKSVLNNEQAGLYDAIVEKQKEKAKDRWKKRRRN